MGLETLNASILWNTYKQKLCVIRMILIVFPVRCPIIWTTWMNLKFTMTTKHPVNKAKCWRAEQSFVSILKYLIMLIYLKCNQWFIYIDIKVWTITQFRDTCCYLSNFCVSTSWQNICLLFYEVAITCSHFMWFISINKIIYDNLAMHVFFLSKEIIFFRHCHHYST